MLFNTGPVQANPTGGVVVHGDVSFQNAGDGNLQMNQSSNQAIIKRAGFSIAPGELTRFIQPGADASILNRVTDGDPSSIPGALEANENVVVIDPNGILVSAGGLIEADGLVLSILDIDNGEILAGSDLVFKGNGNNGVSNLDQINAIGGMCF